MNLAGDDYSGLRSSRSSSWAKALLHTCLDGQQT